MTFRVPKFILVDTGYWFALFDSTDSYHEQALRIFPKIEHSTFVIPWPTLYEVLNTRFLKDAILIQRFDKVLTRPNNKFLVDKHYKRKALAETIELAANRKRQISLVDQIIRKMLENPNLKIDGLVSFNEGDFIDVCTRRRIPILGKLA